jgi:ribonuclease HI
MTMAGRALYIYVDGSCEENRNVTSKTPAGWGLCVISGDSGIGKGGGDVIFERSGPVVTKESADGFLGAEVGSNNTAELSAIAHAMRWLLSEGDSRDVVLRGDSQYALNIASGEWRAKANRELAGSVQALWSEVTSLHSLCAEHVRAHRGHRWNERADHLAFRAMQGEDALPLQFWKPGSR